MCVCVCVRAFLTFILISQCGLFYFPCQDPGESCFLHYVLHFIHVLNSRMNMANVYVY
jgi:hypothetical protein